MLPKLQAILLACILLTVTGSIDAADQNKLPPLRVGLLPSLSTERLVTLFAPLRDYLQEKLHRPVILLTAPSYDIYMQRAANFEYDLYFTAPHMAALAETDSGYRRISLMNRELRGYVLVRQDSAIHTLNDLQGHLIAMPESTAIITILGESLLQEHGLRPGKNIRVEYTPSHNNAIHALSSSKADAAIVSGGIYDATPPDKRQGLNILAKTKTLSYVMFMASPKLPERDYQQLHRVMLQFTAKGPGKEFFEKSKYGDMGEIRDQDMQQLKPYVKILQQRLANHK